MGEGFGRYYGWGRGDVGYGRCEPRIEGIVQRTCRYCTILRITRNIMPPTDVNQALKH